MIRTLGPCGWCKSPVRSSRVDTRWCSKACRQAASRARVRRAELRATDRPLSLAYADPPYPGKASLYRDHPDYGGEVDHAELLARLARFDGWALSTSAAALPAILALAVGQDLQVRVAAWFRGARPHTTARLLNAWEPVVFAGRPADRRASLDRDSTGARRPDRAGAASAADPADQRGRHETARIRDVDIPAPGRPPRRHPGRPVPGLGDGRPRLGRLQRPADPQRPGVAP